jgi:hypothetical protein
MTGTCFGAKNVESILGKLAFGDLAFDNFPSMGRFVWAKSDVDRTESSPLALKALI